MTTSGRTRTVLRRIGLGVVVAVLVFGGLFLVSASRATYPEQRLQFWPDAGTWPGVYHVHTQASDGSGTIGDVVAAAKSSGATWVLVADHNVMEGARARYQDGVLLVFSPEVSVPAGHVTAVGAARALTKPERRAPGALSTIRAVGGAPIAAHPLGRKRPYLRLDDPLLAGLEILSADQEFRDALVAPVRLAPAALAYLVSPRNAMMRLLQRPDRSLARWDELLHARRMAGFCAVDAHGRPPYEAIMATLQMHVVVGHPPTGDAATDGAALLDALVRGRSYCGVETIAAAGGFRLDATTDADAAQMSDEIPLALHPVIHLRLRYVELPPATRASLTCGGVERRLEPLADRDGFHYTYRPLQPGACRAEVSVESGGRTRPWILSNPLYIR